MTYLRLLSALCLLFATGCAFSPTKNNLVPLSPTASTEAVLEAAADAARSSGLPPVTKMDKANGVVEFGGFGMPELGTSAQVRVRSDHQAEVTVKRHSAYVPLGTGKKADQFQAAFESRLRELNLLPR
jgi:hypothetical protein